MCFEAFSLIRLCEAVNLPMVTIRQYLANLRAEALHSPQFRCSFSVNVRQTNIGDHDVILNWNRSMLENWSLMRGLTKHPMKLVPKLIVKKKILYFYFFLNHQREIFRSKPKAGDSSFQVSGIKAWDHHTHTGCTLFR